MIAAAIGWAAGLAAAAPAGLTGYWRLDGDDHDEVGTHDGTFSGVESYATGKLGQALSLDGASEAYLGVGVVSTAAYTKAAWVRRMGDAANNILSGGAVDRHAFYIPVTASNRLAAGHNGTWNQVQDSSAFPSGTWVHAAVTYDAGAGGALRLYRDGRLVASAASVAPPDGGAAYLGAYNGGNNFIGLIDDAGVWDRALSDTEIEQLYIDGLHGVGQGDPTHYVHPVFTNVPEAADFELVYELPIPDTLSLGATGAPPYLINRASRFVNANEIRRIAYYLELRASTGAAPTWAYVSMDAFTGDAGRIGVPSVASGALFQQKVTGMNVAASPGSGVVTGTNLATGNLEFWPYNYSMPNAIGIPNASASAYDAGDTCAFASGYGSMQVHNHDVDGAGPGVTGQTIFAYNRWGGTGGTSDLGIGSRPGQTNTDWTFATNATAYVAKTLLVLAKRVRMPAVAWTDLPQDLQLYPRDLATGRAAVPVAGEILEPGFDAVVVRVDRAGAPWTNLVRALTYAGGSAPFAVSVEIPAELAGYAFRVYVASGGVETLVAAASDVVAGDALLINGQSNAEATMRNGSSAANRSPFIRSFGTRAEAGATVVADTAWHQAEGDVNEGPGASGQWAMRMARHLVDSYGVPIALINAARGGKPISYFQRTDADPANTNTNYGRMLFRARESGLQARARAMLWYQGEAEGGNGATHEAGFLALADDWRADYPALEKIYIFQLRTGCGVTQLDVDLRDRQRRFADRFRDMAVMSTTAADAHDGCHYAYTNGYELLGLRMARLLARDLFGAPAGTAVEAPNPLAASFRTPARNEIAVTMRAADSLGWAPGAHADFGLLGSAVAVTGGYAAGSTLVLKLAGDASSATAVVYGGHSGAGPWVTNALGVGLIAFRQTIRSADAAPGAPAGLAAVVTASNRVDLAWPAVSNATHYLIQRDASPLATVIDLTAYADTGLTPASVYQYRMAAANPVGTSLWSAAVTVTTVVPSASAPVPEAEDFDLLYRIDIPISLALGATGQAPYDIDRSGLLTGRFTRVAYLLELQRSATGGIEWAYVSVDPFTADATKLGVPVYARGAMFQQRLTNMNVYASPGWGLATGRRLSTGNIEFWGLNYSTANTAAVPNASGSVHDGGDQPSTNGYYGSMQIHNYDLDGAGPGTNSQAIFAWNRWGNGGTSDLGIGNQQPPGHPDWTFAGNAGNYLYRRLSVLVRMDADADGLADRWEREHLGGVGGGPGDDPDGDGVSNRDEWVAGTDPADASSFPALRLAGAGAAEIRFATAPDRTYAVESSPNQPGSVWQAWTNGIPGTGGEVAIPIPPGAAARHHRLLITPP